VAPRTGSPNNRLTVQVDAGRLLGDETQELDLNGFMSGRMEWNGERITGMQIDAGELSIQDGRFEWLGGVLWIETLGFQGSPSTVGPSVEIQPDGTFQGQGVVVIFDQGTIRSDQPIFDLADDPWIVSGTADGRVELKPAAAQPPQGDLRAFMLSVTVPIQVEEVFDVGEFPLVGTVQAFTEATGTLEATQIVYLPSLGSSSCPFAGTSVDAQDLTELILHWTGPDGNGQAGASGDCNRDGRVDAIDLTELILAWTGAASQIAPPAGQQAGTMFAPLPVPEPSGIALAASWLSGLALWRRRRAASTWGRGVRHVENRRLF
jgi:hypothetical protein